MGVVLAMTVVLVRGDLSLKPAFDTRAWRNLMSETVVYSAATALGVVYFRVAVLAMSVLANAAQTSFYGVAFRILDLVNAIPWMLVASAFPILARAARDDDERLRYALQRLFDMSLVLGGLFSVCLLCGADFAVAVIGGSEFDESVSVLQILAIGVAGTWLIAVWAFALLTLHAYRALIVINAFVVALAVALSAILIPAEGARGGAVVTVVLELVMALAYGVALVRARPELRPRMGVAVRVVAAVAAALAVGVPLLSVAGSVVATIAAAAAFAVVLAAVRGVPPELYAALKRRRL
jgi:O-antigen/teichoic acid export membrane protein